MLIKQELLLTKVAGEGNKPQVRNQKLTVLIFYIYNSLSIASGLFSLLSHVESIVDIRHGGHII